MSERDGYEPGVPCWVDTLQADVEGATRFYGELFGWEFEGPGQMPGDPPGRYFVARLRGGDVAGVGSQPADRAAPPPAWNTYVWVQSADQAAGRVTDAGGAIVAEPFDVLPAGRMAVLTDPEGAVFCAWEAKERKGAQRVNEAGAWSMSLLNTRDPERAKAFYGSVFGWETEDFDLGGSQIEMWRLPGYVGGEPEQPVPRDVVATMMAMGDQFPDEVPPHWGVDFWVGDVDGTAEQAGDLGGGVVAPPADIPGVPMRSAALADPAGATFSVTELRVPQ
jgi:uncharacterized protein